MDDLIDLNSELFLKAKIRLGCIWRCNLLRSILITALSLIFPCLVGRNSEKRVTDCGTQPIMVPTRKRRKAIQPKEGAIAESSP